MSGGKILEGKKVLIVGVANERSLAWGIAQKCSEQGAQLGMTYLNEKLKRKVDELASEVSCDFTVELDVSHQQHYEHVRQTIQEKWGEFDCLVHSVAFASRESLSGRFVETKKDDFLQACHISAFSFVEMAQQLKCLMKEEGSLMALTYLGADKVIPNYNVMGVAKAALECSSRYLAYDLGREKKLRVNCLSAGPIRTLSSSAVGGIRKMLGQVERSAPLARNVSSDDVGDYGVFLASDLSKNVTGQTLYVDAGHSTMGPLGPELTES